MPNTLLADTARRILQSAYESEHGIEVLVESPPAANVIAPALRAKQVLYRFKKENAEYSNLQILLHPTKPDNTLMIIKKPAENPRV